MKTIQKMIADNQTRSRIDAQRFAELDGDECQLCGAYGADKRSLFVRCFYAIHEVVPEVIDLSEVEGHDRGYYLRICKTCRGEFLAMMGEWRDRRVARRDVPKDHDGGEFLLGGEDMVPVRRHGRTVWMTPEQYEDFKGSAHTGGGRMKTNMNQGIPEPEYRERVDALIGSLNAAHHEAHALGLYRTGHKLHAGVQEIGYEYAEVLEGFTQEGLE